MTRAEPSAARTLRETSSVCLASAYLEAFALTAYQERTLQHWRGDYYNWDGVIYRKLELEQFRSRVNDFLKQLRVMKKGKAELYRPEPRNVKAVIETMAMDCQVHAESMPVWIDRHRPAPANIIAFQNGLLNLAEVSNGVMVPLIPPTPLWFSTLVIPYDFEHFATCPKWLTFLSSSLRKDGNIDMGAIALLQEWFGYCMTSDTRHQKLMLLIGPPRCGKGTIIRTMQRLVGQANCASPQFSSLNQPFGLEPLLGKRVATVPDAHLGRDDNAIGVLDRILQISGEDSITVNRKYQAAIADVKLGVRFTIGANEPPDLPDSSGAIITRMLMVHFHESFVGREDLSLDDKLAPEIPGIAVWAIEGLKRLRKNGRFTEPNDAERLKNDYMRQTAPILAFLQDRCEFGSTADHSVSVDDLWQAWKEWANRNGNHPGSKEGFAKRLRAANPKLYRKRTLISLTQVYVYVGIRLLQEGVLPFRPGDDSN